MTYVHKLACNLTSLFWTCYFTVCLPLLNSSSAKKKKILQPSVKIKIEIFKKCHIFQNKSIHRDRNPVNVYACMGETPIPLLLFSVQLIIVVCPIEAFCNP